MSRESNNLLPARLGRIRKLILLVAVILAGCEEQRPNATKTVANIEDRNIKVYVLDGCEYIGDIYGGYGDWATHKGNCKYCVARGYQPLREQIFSTETKWRIGDEKIRTYTIDGCQYIGDIYGGYGDWATHKGNCKYCAERFSQLPDTSHGNCKKSQPQTIFPKLKNGLKIPW